MSDPRRARFQTLPGVSAPRRASEGPVLAAGWRVVVTCPDKGSGRVPLTDVDGTCTLATVATGAEVEILAWRPRRAGGVRYHVASVGGGVEGWLGAGSLRRRERPAVPGVPGTVTPAGGLPAQRTRAESPSAHRAPVAAKAVAKKAVGHPPAGKRRKSR